MQRMKRGEIEIESRLILNTLRTSIEIKIDTKIYMYDNCVSGALVSVCQRNNILCDVP